MLPTTKARRVAEFAPNRETYRRRLKSTVREYEDAHGAEAAKELRRELRRLYPQASTQTSGHRPVQDPDRPITVGPSTLPGRGLAGGAASRFDAAPLPESIGTSPIPGDVNDGKPPRREVLPTL